MTDIDYVTQVAELLRDHSWQRVDTMGRITCASETDEHIYTGINHEQHQAEALAAAGLIPTSVEWGVRHSQGIREERNEKWAREWAEADVRADAGRKIEARGRTQLVSRAVTDWKDAT